MLKVAELDTVGNAMEILPILIRGLEIRNEIP